MAPRRGRPQLCRLTAAETEEGPATMASRARWLPRDAREIGAFIPVCRPFRRLAFLVAKVTTVQGVNYVQVSYRVSRWGGKPGDAVTDMSR